MTMIEPPSLDGKPLEPLPLGRSVAEWIGATNDTPVPKKVRIRVFQRYGGCCYLTRTQIRPGDVWEIEHIKPVWQARPGEILNRESNLAPALKAPHAIKSAEEAGDRAKSDRITAKHFGIKGSDKSRRGFRKHPSLKRTVDGRVVPRFQRP